MLNVSGQKQKHCSFPLTLAGSSMEFAGRPRLSEACNLLAVPDPCSLYVDEDEREMVTGIRPNSSPQPRRKSSVTDEDSEAETTLSVSRRVSFADAKGLSLVYVKEFDTWDVPELPSFDTWDGEGRDVDEHYLSTLTFSRPLPSEELFEKVQQQKLELETIELLPGTTIVRGVIQVLNISYHKTVLIRTTLDQWSTHFDLLAEYIPGSSDGAMDLFSFKLTLVPPFGEQGARVDFCLRYETPVGTFWSNNNDRNYIVCCHRKKGGKQKSRKENMNKKSCLKAVNPNVSTVENMQSYQESSPEDLLKDGSNSEAEVQKTKAESRSRISEEKKQELLVENRQNSVRSRRRKAARLAKVRDYFALRNGEASDSDKDESHPEVKQATPEETLEEKHAEVQVCTTGSNKSEDTQFAFENLERSKELPNDDHTAAKEEEKSVTEVQANQLQSAEQSSPPKEQNVWEFGRKSVEESQKQEEICASVGNSKGGDRERVNGQTGPFTFGTVVAPLYHQVFGKAGSEKQSEGGETKLVETDGFHSCFEQEVCGDIVQRDVKSNSSKVQENTTDDCDSNHSLNSQTSTSNTQSLSDIKQEMNRNGTHKSEVPNPLLKDALNGLDDDLWLETSQKCCQTEKETEHYRQAAKFKPLPEQTRAQITINTDDQVFKPPQFVSKQIMEVKNQKSSRPEVKENEQSEMWNICLSPTSDSSSSLKKNLIESTETADSMCSLDSYQPERQNFIFLNLNLLESPEETSSKKIEETKTKPAHEVAELLKNVNQNQSEIFLKVQHGLEKMEQRFLEAAIPKQDGNLCSTVTNGLKNWEMMVEEEENMALLNKEESNLKNKATEAMEEDSAEMKREEREEMVNETVGKEMDTMEELEEMERIKGEEIVAEETITDDTSDPVKVPEAEMFGDNEGETVKREKSEKQQVCTDSMSAQEEEKVEKFKNNQKDEAVTDHKLSRENTDSESRGEFVRADKCPAKVNKGSKMRDCEVFVITQSEITDSLSDLESDKMEDKKESMKENQHEHMQTCFLTSCSEGDTRHPPEDEEQTCEDSASASSDSDDEVELYMHCLRAVGTSTQAQKEKLIITRRSSLTRAKLLSTPMPSIRESLDEEQHLCGTEDSYGDMKTAPSNLRGARNNMHMFWKETFSIKKISKTLLYLSLMGVFLVVAMHYDFLAFFGLYLISVVWLCCQKDEKPLKNNKTE